MMRRWGITLLMTAGCVACGGGSGGDAVPGGGSGDGSLYVGYYVEDASNNPEDPTIGAVLMRLPATNGSFSGQMPFSYAGCVSGVDVGGISGSRTGSNYAGNWAGTMDGSAVGGSFDLTADTSGGTYSGTYTNAAGKQSISVGSCSYYVAARGTVKLYPSDTSTPTSFVLSAGTGLPPTLSWPSLGTGIRYSIKVFDETCLQNNPSNASCFKGETTTTSLSTILDASSGLVAGTRYRAVVTAQQSTGEFAGFATITFVPTSATGSSSSSSSSNSSSAITRGTLSITGSGAASLGGSFVSGADRFGNTTSIQTSGPTCSSLIGGGTSCSSYLDVTWGEYDAFQLPQEVVGVHFTSTASAPGVAPGTSITGAVVTASTANSSASFGLACLSGATCTLANLGMDLNTTARTITFRDVPLASLRSDGLSIVLNGTLSY